MPPKFPQLRLRVPSLFQGNKKGDKRGSDWCGRTSASMIWNYYFAARKGGIAAAKDQLIVNQRDASPYDLIFRDGKQHGALGSIAASGYRLAQTAWDLKAKPWNEETDRQRLFGGAAREELSGQTPDEAKISEFLEPVWSSLDAFNPVLFYSGMSSSTHHIIVISGYRFGDDGSLWLHIDDPGQRGLTADGEPAKVRIAALLSRYFKHAVEPLEPDTNIEANNTKTDGIPGVRYWLRASMLFAENTNTGRAGDLWCDHGYLDRPSSGSNRPGFQVITAKSAEGMSPLVEVPLEATTPVDKPLAELWSNARESGAPFPLGANLTWHDGIHITGANQVRAIAPGVAMLARFPEADGGAARGMVVVKHAIDTKTLLFHPPIASDELPENAKWIYSLYANLQGGEAGIARFLEPLRPGNKPELDEFANATTPMLPLVTVDNGDGADEAACLPIAGTMAPSTTYAKSTLASASASGTDYHTVPVEHTNLHAWKDAPAAPLAPVDAELGYHCEILGDVLSGAEHKVTEKLAPRMAVDDADGEPKLRQVGGDWYALEPYDAPGVMLRGRWGIHDKTGLREIPSGDAALIVRSKSVLVSAGGKRYWVAVGGKFRRPRLIACDPESAAAKAGAADKDVARPRWIACVSSQGARDNNTRTSTRATLRFWDPASGAHFNTGRTLGKKVTIVARPDGLPGNRHAIEGYEPEIITRTSSCYGLAPSEVDRLRTTAQPLLFLDGDKPKLWLSTYGTGSRRRFRETHFCELEAPACFAVPNGPERAGKWRAWPRLTPCVKLTAKQVDALEAALKAAREKNHGDTLARLRHGKSCLVWVSLRARDGWMLDGAAVVPNPDLDLERLTIHRFITRKGTKAYRKRKGYDHVTLTVAPDDLPRMACISTVGTRRPRAALVELQFGVEELADNQDQLDLWDKCNDLHASLSEQLAGEELVDLSEAYAEITDQDIAGEGRFRQRELAGTFALSGALTPGGAPGLHVQVFAGEHVIPAATAGGGWRVVEADGDDPPGSGDFLRKQLAALLADNQIRDQRFLGEDPPTRQEWVSHCTHRDVARALSRVVAKHRTEWAFDFDGHADENPGTLYRALLRRLSVGERSPIFPASFTLPGLEGEDFYFYHPLRFTEWLTTGINLRFSGLSAETRDRLEVGLNFESQHYALEPVVLPGRTDDDPGQPLYRFRTVLGDTQQLMCAVREATLVLKGLVEGEEEKVPVQLRPGEVVDVRLTEPAADIALQHRALGLDLPIRVARRSKDRTGWTGADKKLELLADGDAKLSGSGCGSALATVDVRYNPARRDADPPEDIPETVKIELDGEGFTFGEIEVHGVAHDGPAKGWSDKTTHELTLTPLTERPEYVTNAASYQIRVPVVPGANVGKTAKLVIEVSGGALAEPVSETFELTTADVGPGKGEDAAKLQLYLSQILALDGKPCLRSRRGKASIDGDYGGATGDALVRFIEAYGYEGTVNKQGDHPIVDQELLDFIVEHYAMPFALPSLELEVAKPDPLPASDKWDGWSSKQRSLVLPVAEQDDVIVGVKLASPMGGAGALQVTLELDGEDYALLTPATTTLGALVKDGIALQGSGRLSARRSKPKLTIRATDAARTRLGKIALGGCPDLMKAGGKGLGVAHLQAALKEFADANDKPYYDGAVDGKWGGKAKKGLAKLLKDTGTTGSFSEVAALVLAGPEALAPVAEAAE